jgi:hypothetical protein
MKASLWGACLMAQPSASGCLDVANMAPYAISSSSILMIHDNMINGTNHNF